MATPSGASPALVPVHPEAVSGDPLALRWVAATGALGFVGEPTRMPSTLTALVLEGALVAVSVTPTAVVTRLGGGRTWRAEGGRVRDALQAALADPAGWAAPSDATPDDALRMAVEEVVAGDVGAYVRSHGGDIELVSVSDGRVEVRMTGTCTHCPAADETLGGRFETALRALHPQVREVTAHVRGLELRAGVLRLPLLTIGRR